MLFKNKTMNEQAAVEFWKWFEMNEAWIIQQCNGSSEETTSLVYTIDEKIAPIFPYIRNIEFQLGANYENEFFLFYRRKKALLRDAETFKQMMPDAIKANWNFHIEKQ